MTKPDADRGHVDSPASDDVALSEPGCYGTVLAELAERPLDNVALLVSDRSEGGRPTARLPRRSRLRTWSAGSGMIALTWRRHRSARIAALECALCPEPVPEATQAAPRDLQPGQSAGRKPASRAGARRWSPGQRPTPRLGQQVNLAGQPPRDRPSTSRFLSFAATTWHTPERSAQPAPAPPGPHQPTADAAPRRRAGAPAPPSRPPRPLTAARVTRSLRPAAGPGSSSRSHPQTSGDAGHNLSFNLAGAALIWSIPSGSSSPARVEQAATARPAAADRWTWLLIVYYAQLYLARPATATAGCGEAALDWGIGPRSSRPNPPPRDLPPRRCSSAGVHGGQPDRDLTLPHIKDETVVSYSCTPIRNQCHDIYLPDPGPGSTGEGSGFCLCRAFGRS
jgi:hypothetical protein